MSKPIAQHYIPKTYLRQFQIDDLANKSFVYCIDFSNEYKTRVQRVGINDKIFKLRKYYNDNRLEDPYSLENIFAKEIEPLYVNIIKAIRSEGYIPQNIREDIITWTFVSKMRNPDFRNNINRVMSKIIDITHGFQGKTLSFEERISLDTYIKNTAKEIQLDSFWDKEQLEKIGELHTSTLICKQWRILKSKKDFPFWTNDNPGFSPNLHPKFSIHNPFHNVMELNGASVIYYVLSPEYCLEILPFSEGTPMTTNALNMDIHFTEASVEYIAYINNGVFLTKHKLVISNLNTYLDRCIRSS